MILHTISSISEEASGPTYSVVRLCESLLAESHYTKLAALDWSPITTPLAFLKTFPLGIGPRRLGRSPEFHRWIENQVQMGTISLIHNHGLWMMPNVYSGWVSSRYNIPLVVSPRGMLSERAYRSGSIVKKLFWPLVQKPAFRKTACFHATAQSEYEDIRRIGFRQPIGIIPNGIDIPNVSKKETGRFRTLLFLGRIHPIKGLDNLLPAWQAVHGRFPEWQLRIVGPDNKGYLAQIQILAKQLQLGQIELTGKPLYGKQKWQAYRDADLFVLPTYSENFGMAVAESLAVGTPAIVTKGAPWEGLGQHGAGWWIEVGLDPLVACLETALACSTEKLEEMGQRGRGWMMQDFSWRQISKKMAATYTWIKDGGPKPAWIIED